MTSGVADRFGLLAWSAFLAAAVWFLHVVGGAEVGAPPLLDPASVPAWLETVGLEVAVVAIVRLVALSLAWYLVVTTVVGSLVRITGAGELQAATDRVTPRFVRSLLGSAGTVTAAGLTLAVSPLLAPGAGPLDPAPAHAGEGDNAGLGSLNVTRNAGVGTPAWLRPIEAPEPAVLLRIDRPQLRDDPSPIEIAALAPLVPSEIVETWTVEPGDHLWLIAAETLTDAWGRTVTDGEVTPYWLDVIEANRPNLVAPDNPDLIYPGQVMALPPVPSSE